jgi:hypothetical protein
LLGIHLLVTGLSSLVTGYSMLVTCHLLLVFGGCSELHDVGYTVKVRPIRNPKSQIRNRVPLYSCGLIYNYEIIVLVFLLVTSLG